MIWWQAQTLPTPRKFVGIKLSAGMKNISQRQQGPNSPYSAESRDGAVQRGCAQFDVNKVYYAGVVGMVYAVEKPASL